MSHEQNLQAEQSILLEMAQEAENKAMHEMEVRSAYLEEHRECLAQYEKEYNSEPHY